MAIADSSVAVPKKGGKKGNVPSLQDFQMKKVLGRGTYGKVTKAIRRTDNKLVAVKTMQKHLLIEEDVLHFVAKEKAILAELSTGLCPLIIKLEDCFTTALQEVLVLEYVPGGNLLQLLERQEKFTYDQAKFYFAETACALRFLHAQRVIYRDMKPDNILLSQEGHIVLADFGFADMVPEATNCLDAFCGTRDYLAPEMVNSDIRPYSFEVDWWSLGVVLYEMLTGVVPWTHSQATVVYEKICEAPLPRRALEGDAWVCLQAVLAKNLSERLHTFEAIVAHKFFVDVDFDAAMRLEMTPPFVPGDNIGDDNASQSSHSSCGSRGSSSPGSAQSSNRGKGPKNNNNKGKKKRK